MVLVNDRKIRTYFLDDFTTFKKRVAVDNLQTLVKYVYFPNGKPVVDMKFLKSRENIIVKNFFAEILSYARKNVSYTKLIDRAKEIFGEYINISEDVLPYYLVYNKDLVNGYRTYKDSILPIAKELVKDKYFIAEKQVYDIFENRKSIEDDLKSMFDIEVKLLRRKDELFKKFEELKSVKHTEIEVTNIVYKLALDLDSALSPIEVFNSLTVSESIPLVHYNSYYKVEKEYIPKSYDVRKTYKNVTKDDEITLRVIKSDGNYSDSKLYLENGTYFFDLELSLKKDMKIKDKIFQTILDIFDQEVTFLSIEEKEISGLFYLPGTSFNNYVFSDLVLNDELFKIFMSINESQKATKDKTGVYTVFDFPKTGRFSTILLSKKFVKENIEIRGIFEEDFVEGSSFTRVSFTKIKGRDKIEIYRKVISKLFSYYNQESPEIIDFYRRFIPDFAKAKTTSVKERIGSKLSDFDKKLFVSGYSRTCRKGRLPTLVDESQVDGMREQGAVIMKYPRDRRNDWRIQYNSDGVDQKYYTCLHDKHKFPGIIVNKTLTNKEDYPLIPCCFTNDQSKSISSKYTKYYSDIDINPDKKASELIVTKKILKKGQFGTLPEQLNKVFSFVKMVGKFQGGDFMRQGVFRTKSSFIDCVLTGLDSILDFEGKEINYLSIIPSFIPKYLEDIRQMLADDTHAILCKQELYDMTISDIILEIKNTNIYLDPSKYLHMFEVIFGCKIFLFSESMNGSMVIPRNMNGYIRLKSNLPSIYIYEHKGSERDSSLYPQCELIVHKSSSAKTSFTSKESSVVDKIFRKINLFYRINKPVYEKFFGTPNFEPMIKGQIFDTYGKVRYLLLDFEGENISLHTEPLPPFLVPELKEKNIIKLSSMSRLEKFLSLINAEIISQDVNNDVSTLTCITGNVSFTIPIQTGIKGFPNQKSLFSIKTSMKSSIDEFSEMRQIARYISEYFMWVFSVYIKSGNIVEITDSTFDDFVSKEIIFIPNYEYKKVGKQLTRENSFFQENKLIIKNDEMLKRLIYLLRLNLERDLMNILTYSDAVNMRNYVTNITDFTKKIGETILWGYDSFVEWMEERTDYNIHRRIDINIFKPYFIQVNNKDIFLVQNCASSKIAKKVAVMWDVKNNNPGYYALGVPNDILSSYEDKDFTVYKFSEEEGFRKIKEGKIKTMVVIHKFRNMVKYSVFFNI